MKSWFKICKDSAKLHQECIREFHDENACLEYSRVVKKLLLVSANV